MDKRKLNESDMILMRIPRRYWECSYKGINKVNRKYIDDYLKHRQELIDKGVGLLFWGDNGKGKTGASVVLAKELKRHYHKVLFVEASNLKNIVVNKVYYDEYTTLWQKIQSVEVLFLDDLGKGTLDKTGFGVRLIDGLIRHRNANKDPTFVTTNMNDKQIKEFLKKSTIHTFKECLFPVFFKGEDLREKNKREIKEFFSE